MSSSSTKQVILTANFESHEAAQISMDTMRCYCQNAGLEDIFDGTRKRPKLIIEDADDPRNIVYGPNGDIDIDASADLLADRQRDRQDDKNDEDHYFDKKVKKFLILATNWLQSSSEKHLLKRLRIKDDEWWDVLKELRDTHLKDHVMGRIKILEDFNALSIKKGQSYKNFISTLSDSLSNLREANQPISDDQKKLKLINNAPNHIKNLLQFHMSTGANYEEMRKQALAWAPTTNSTTEITANATEGHEFRGGGRNGRGAGRSGGRVRGRIPGDKYDHKNRYYGQQYQGARDLHRGGRDGRFNRGGGRDRGRGFQGKCFNCNEYSNRVSANCPEVCGYCGRDNHKQEACRDRLANRPANNRNIQGHANIVDPYHQQPTQPTSYTVTVPIPPAPPLIITNGPSMNGSTNNQLPAGYTTSSSSGSGQQFNFGNVWRSNRPSGSVTILDISADSITSPDVLAATIRQPKEIVTDGCATYHLWADRDDFTEYYPLNDNSMFATSSGGNKMKILGFGAVGGLHHVFLVQGLVKNLVSLAYISNILKYTYVGRPGECTLYDRDQVTPLWTAVISDGSLLPKLDRAAVFNVRLTMPDGSPMRSTPEAMGLSSCRS